MHYCKRFNLYLIFSAQLWSQANSVLLKTKRANKINLVTLATPNEHLCCNICKTFRKSVEFAIIRCMRNKKVMNWCHSLNAKVEQLRRGKTLNDRNRDSAEIECFYSNLWLCSTMCVCNTYCLLLFQSNQSTEKCGI